MSDLYGPLDEKKKKRKKAGTESSKESSLRDWFGRKGAKGKKKGWVDCNAPDGKGGYKSCGRSGGEKRKKYPACRPTPGACKERGKGKSWGKKAKRKSRKNEELYMDLEQIIQEELEAVLDEKRKKKKKKKKKKAKKDACYHKVKSRYKVWPSAYASGALVKCRKVGAKNWGNSKKEHLRTIIEDELTQVLQETALDGPVPSMRRPGVGHSGMFNEPEPEEYKKIKAKISEIIDDIKEELSFLSGAESALEEMKRKMLDPEQFDFNLAMGTDTYGRDSKPRAVYEERPKFGQFYMEFRNAVAQELNDKLESGEITENQLYEIVYFADYRVKNASPKGQYSYPSIARLKWIYKNLIQRDKYNRDENGISIDTLPDRETISNERYLEEKNKKPCKPSKGKRFAKRVNGKCRSYGQKGKAKDGGDRIRPGTKKGDAYCARSAKIKKCKNPPCANDLSRKKWKCRGSKSMKE